MRLSIFREESLGIAGSCTGVTPRGYSIRSALSEIKHLFPCQYRWVEEDEESRDEVDITFSGPTKKSTEGYYSERQPRGE